jgi:hypothetical protein
MNIAAHSEYDWEESKKTWHFGYDSCGIVYRELKLAARDFAQPLWNE